MQSTGTQQKRVEGLDGSQWLPWTCPNGVIFFRGLSFIFILKLLRSPQLKWVSDLSSTVLPVCKGVVLDSTLQLVTNNY